MLKSSKVETTQKLVSSYMRSTPYTAQKVEGLCFDIYKAFCRQNVKYYKTGNTFALISEIIVPIIIIFHATELQLLPFGLNRVIAEFHFRCVLNSPSLIHKSYLQRLRIATTGFHRQTPRVKHCLISHLSSYRMIRSTRIPTLFQDRGQWIISTFSKMSGKPASSNSQHPFADEFDVA